jgi:hypothetical protein
MSDSEVGLNPRGAPHSGVKDAKPWQAQSLWVSSLNANEAASAQASAEAAKYNRRFKAGGKHKYRVVAVADAMGCARQIEFYAPSVSAALFRARSTLPNGVIELFENGQFLGAMRWSRNGIWTVRSCPRDFC